MAEQTKNYNPARIAMVFGVIPITGGFAEGTFCKITPSGEMFKKKRGADGSVARTKTNAFDGTVEITLLQTATANGLLSAQATIDEQGNNGAGVSPLTISNLDGSQAFFAEESWIEKRPDIEYANEVGEWTWVFGYAHGTRVDGGS